MPEPIDHDTWHYGLIKTRRAPEIDLGEIYGVSPFDGVRNPGGRSVASQKVIFSYCTRAGGSRPKVGMAESSAEVAVGFEVLLAKTTYDLQFQPLEVSYKNDDGETVSYTHDVRIVARNGHRRLVFVRNDDSLSKALTWRNIQAMWIDLPPAGPSFITRVCRFEIGSRRVV